MHNIRALGQSLALAGILLACSLHAADADPCKLVQLASLELLPNKSGEILVPVTINGTPRYMLLELEDNVSILTPSTADDLHLSRALLPPGDPLHRANHSINYSVHISQMLLGAAEGKDIDMLIAFMDEAEQDPRISGVLGMGILRNFDVELDMQHNKLNLFSPSQCNAAPVYWSPTHASMPLNVNPTGSFQVTMQLDGKPVSVSFASVTDKSFLGFGTAHRLFGLDHSSEGVTTADPKNGIFRYPFRELSADGLTIKNPAIFLSGSINDPPCDSKMRIPYSSDVFKCAGIAELNLGNNELRALHFYFAFQKKTLYFTAADAH